MFGFSFFFPFQTVVHEKMKKRTHLFEHGRESVNRTSTSLSGFKGGTCTTAPHKWMPLFEKVKPNHDTSSCGCSYK